MKSSSFAMQLKKIHSKLSAVDMEAKALFQAIHLSSQDAAALIVRGISDYADTDKENTDDSSHGAFRRAAVRAAATFVSTLIQRELIYGGTDRGASVPLALNLVPARRSPLIAREHELIGFGPNTICAAFDELLVRPSGTPALSLTATVEEPDAEIRWSLRQQSGPWHREYPQSTSPSGNWEIERSSTPYQLSLVLVANCSSLKLRVAASSEFGNRVEATRMLGKKG